MIVSSARQIRRVSTEVTRSRTPPWLRRAACSSDVSLLAMTDDWLCALPKGARPLRMPGRFPRITNELARLWNDHHLLGDYFREKEGDQRGDRIGFEPIIKEELFALRVHSASAAASNAREQQKPQTMSIEFVSLQPKMPGHMVYAPLHIAQLQVRLDGAWIKVFVSESVWRARYGEHVDDFPAQLLEKPREIEAAVSRRIARGSRQTVVLRVEDLA
jgi:hypothetical protein